MFDNKTEKEIAIMLQEDPALLQKVKRLKEMLDLLKEMLDLFDEMTPEQKSRLLVELRPSYPAVADAFTEILSMDGGPQE